MIKRIYVDNFKCLQQFELNLKDLNSAFLLGKNGSGKSTVFEVIEFFQKIGHGTTNLQDLIDEKSFSFSDVTKLISLELEVEINKKLFKYSLIIEFPKNFNAARIKKETLLVDKETLLKREGGQTTYKNNAHFLLDWHHIGLPLVSAQSSNDPIVIFKEWLKSIIIVAPYPKQFLDISKVESAKLNKDGSNVMDFSRWLLSSNPSLYVPIFYYLKSKMPDLETFKFDNIGRDDRNLIFEFGVKSNKKIFDFKQLSDGEQIFFLAATILAAQRNNSNLLCLWDEPDNFIGLKEMNNFIMEFRKAFEDTNSQLLITSHNERAINRFSNHNIFVLSRSSHLSSTKVKVLKDIDYLSSTVVEAFENDELEFD